MIHGISHDRQRTLSWSIFLIAIVSFVCLGWAEQGVRGVSMVDPPSSPLPFNRQQVFGLDLREHSSLSALQWLTSADFPDTALIVIPIDADVVVALGEGEIQDAALAATDSLVTAGAGSPLAVCLRRPDVSTDLADVAAIAVESLIDRYPDVIAYVFACNHASESDWREAVAASMSSINPRMTGVTETLLPVSSGAPAALMETSDPVHVQISAESGNLSRGYSIVSLRIDGSLPTRVLRDAQDAIQNTSHLGLILLRPTTDVDPAMISAALRSAPLQPDSLLEGFSNATLDAISVHGDWQAVKVGTVQYLRSTAETATLVTEFVGTDLFLLAVRSPNAGRIHAWIDPPASGLPAIPDVSLDLNAPQARDGLYPLFTGLSAARHRVVVVAVNTDQSNVTMSGFFVTGRRAPAWTGGFAAVTFLVIAAAALTERCAASIWSIRRTSGPPMTREGEHPRGFTRRH
jgi:hypothetical protein